MSATRAHVVAGGERTLFEHHPVPSWEFDCEEAFAWLEHHAPTAQGPHDELTDAQVAGFAQRLRALDVNRRAVEFLRCATAEAAMARYEDGHVLAHRLPRKAVSELWRGETFGSAETTTTLGNGEIRSVSVCLAVCPLLEGVRSRLVLSVQDTTAQREIEAELRREAKQLEDALRQSQKMEAFGQLAAGVAHDFNNLLTVMIGNLDLLASGEPVDPEVTQELQQAVTRASTLTRQLLAFSRQAPQAQDRVDLNDVASNMARLLKRLIGNHITFEVSLDPAPLVVSANAGMLEQVLVNLTLNARDAMPQGGELRITTRRAHLSSTEAKERPQGRAGHFAVLSVSDTGTGMDASLVERIFEPFFTTKDAGKGTGLGLATALGIVQQHHGWIDVQSIPGRGSAFQVFIPLEDQALEAPARARRVLIAEDEAPVRRLLRRLLEKAGFDVLEANSGTQALEVWAREKDQIALLITDMVMPGGISGRQLATRMTLEKPDLKVMYASGYVPEGADALTLPGAVFITKPFSRDELVRKVSELLA